MYRTNRVMSSINVLFERHALVLIYVFFASLHSQIWASLAQLSAKSMQRTNSQTHNGEIPLCFRIGHTSAVHTVNQDFSKQPRLGRAAVSCLCASLKHFSDAEGQNLLCEVLSVRKHAGFGWLPGQRCHVRNKWLHQASDSS